MEHIHNISFSFLATNVHDKQECYITLGWKGLIITKTLAYWAPLQIMKQMKCCEYDSRRFDPPYNT
jgi:hypothetical protein